MINLYLTEMSSQNNRIQTLEQERHLILKKAWEQIEAKLAIAVTLIDLPHFHGLEGGRIP